MDDVVIAGLLRTFQQTRDLAQLKEAEAFEAFAAFCVLSRYYEAEFSPDAYRMGGGNDLGIDAYGLLVNGDLLRDEAEVRDAIARSTRIEVQIVVIQAKTSATFETKVVPYLADNLRVIFSRDPLPYPASQDIDNLRRCLSLIFVDHIGKLGGLPRLHLYYVTTASQTADLILASAREAEKQLEKLNLFDEVALHLVTARELRELYQRATQAVEARFTMVKRVPLPAVTGVEQSFLGLLPARELVERVLTDPAGGVRKSLFHENVRDFQDYNDVNREIQETLRDPDKRQRFAVFNNGITIITRDLQPVGDEIRIRDFQIVNGCQTCHVLFGEREHLTDAVQVSVRIVQSRDENVISGIVQATNRQTAVSKEELSARDQFHKELEAYFEAHEPPRRLFYERRSKQYSERTDVEKTRIVTRAQLGRAYEAMFLGVTGGQPHAGRRRRELFHKADHVIAYYTAAAASYRLDWLFRNRKIAKQYSSVRDHMLAAMKEELIGPERLPVAPRQAERKCRAILEVVWHSVESEKLVLDLLPRLRKLVDDDEH